MASDKSKDQPKVSARDLYTAAPTLAEKVDVLAALVFDDVSDAHATKVAEVFARDDARTDWDNTEDQTRYEELAKYEDRLGTTGSQTADKARFSNEKASA